MQAIYRFHDRLTNFKIRSRLTRFMEKGRFYELL